MTYGAYGLVEVVGEANAILVTDRMLKTSEVEYVTQDTKCGGHALVFVGGDVAAVKAAGKQNCICRPFRKISRKARRMQFFCGCNSVDFTCPR